MGETGAARHADTGGLPSINIRSCPAASGIRTVQGQQALSMFNPEERSNT